MNVTNVISLSIMIANIGASLVAKTRRHFIK